MSDITSDMSAEGLLMFSCVRQAGPAPPNLISRFVSIKSTPWIQTKKLRDTC